MKRFITSLALLTALGSTLLAQPPGGGRGFGGPGQGDNPIARLMALDTNKDGTLTEDEYTDSRLKPLLQRADANQDKIITQDELAQLMQREGRQNGFGGGPEGGPGMGPEGFGRGGEFGGRGGGRGMRPMMQPGIVLPEPVQQELQLNEQQRAAVAQLQMMVDTELAKILTAEQKQMLQMFGQRRPEGEFGGQGGPGGFGGPGRQGGGPGGQGGFGGGERPPRQ